MSVPHCSTAADLFGYERALSTARPLTLVTESGRRVVVDVGRWLADVDTADATVVTRCRGPVIDLGCGPGRFGAALSAAGRPSVGVDVSPTAVALARGRGVLALLGDLFDALPAEGCWLDVLLMDGNVGIGGDPRALLARTARLLAATGRVHVEVDSAPHTDRRLRLRSCDPNGDLTGTFDWALVGAHTLSAAARPAGLRVVDAWTASGRTFVSLAAD